MHESSHPPPAPSREGFRTTQWSLVTAAAAEAGGALEELCTAYWPPILGHLRRLGYHVADAEDLAQAFFTRLLEKRLISAADTRRGRFRTFLLTALRRFIINEWRQTQTTKRGGGRTHISLSFSAEALSAAGETRCNATPEQQFERQWALVVLERAFQALEAEQISGDQRRQFEALAPFLAGESQTGYDELARQLDATTGALRMAVSRMRTRLRELIRREVRQTVQTEAEVDDEIAALFEALRR